MNPGSLSHCPLVQMSVLILSRELSIFVRVFLMRNAVSLAEGFWYQHSFISLAMEVRVWGEEKSVNERVNAAVTGVCM